jgi:hypothetical protein
MTPTIDQLLTPTSGQAYSIDDVLSAIGGQYQSQPTYTPSLSIDEILANLGSVPASVSPFEYGAKRFVSDVAPSEYFTPAQYDEAKYRMEYESAADKAQRVYNETYADQIAAGKSQQEAQQKAAENAKFWGTAGAIAGSFMPIPGGSVIGGLVGSKLGNTLDDVTSGIADVFGW